MNQEDKSKAIKDAFKKAMVLIVVIYIIILIIDAWLHPLYTGWMVALFTIGGMLVGMGTGFIMAFKIRFSTVMKRKTDGEMIREIQTQSPGTPSSGNLGLDDKE